MGRWYPEILHAPWTEEGAKVVEVIADERAALDRQARKEWWLWKKEMSEAAARRWVRQEQPEMPRRPVQGPVHPQRRADAFRDTWAAIMCPRDENGAPITAPPLEDLAPWLAWVPVGGWGGGPSSVNP